MDARNNPSRLVQVTIALVLLVTTVLLVRGVSELLVLAVGALLVTNYLAYRYAYTYPDDRYPRHGDRMD
jgi:hypothetical protein